MIRDILAIALAVPLAGMTARPARAAFDLRDASPAALGAVSTDLRAEPMFETYPLRGLGAGVSHATLFRVEGLTAEQAVVRFGHRSCEAELSLAQIGFPGARELAASVTLREGGGRPIALAVQAERLELAIDGEPRSGGFALGASVAGRLPISELDAEVRLGGDRIVRSPTLRSLGVEPSVPITIRLRSRAGSVAWVDRWQSDGRRSPRLVVEVALGAVARARLARGGSPGRTGAALALRWGRIEVSAGRQDDSFGGTVAAAALSLLPAGHARSAGTSGDPDDQARPKP